MPFTVSRRLGSMRPSTKDTSVSERLGREENVEGPSAPNIVIYGETGAGKSSIINLIAGEKITQTSNDAIGCTFQHQRYIVSVDGRSCALWDTTGLDEGTEGTVPAQLAESNLTALIQQLAHSQGIHLIIYCIRATRLTKALKRNYDLFYVTVFRKKVPVALVVTGLEHRQDAMETWWYENEDVLRRYRMRFDAHACVTTLDVEDHVIEQRRADSQRLLRDLVARYSNLPAWKTDPSFISRVLPAFRAVFHRTSSTGKQEDTTAMRKVIVCDMADDSDTSVEFSPGINGVWEKFTTRIGDGQYEFIRVHKHALQTPTITPTLRMVEEIGLGDAGLLLFYTSPLFKSYIPPTDIDALREFYDVADGEIRPMIVVLRGCDNGQDAQTCWAAVTSRYSSIQAHLVPLSSGADGKSDTQEKLDELIEQLYVEHAEGKVPRFNRKYIAGKRFLVGMVKRSVE